METTTPNHHADHPGFSGLSGTLAALAMASGHRNDSQVAADLVGLQPDDRVVDIGCGPGNAVRHAARTATAIGVDPAPTMLRVARLLSFGRRSTDFLEGTAEALPLPDRSATVAWALATVHHWPDLASAAAEIHRVLQPRGRYLAIERHTVPGATGLASHGWTDEQAEGYGQLLADAGFTDIAVTRHPGPRRNLIAVRADLA